MLFSGVHVLLAGVCSRPCQYLGRGGATSDSSRPREVAAAVRLVASEANRHQGEEESSHQLGPAVSHSPSLSAGGG